MDPCTSLQHTPGILFMCSYTSFAFLASAWRTLERSCVCVCVCWGGGGIIVGSGEDVSVKTRPISSTRVTGRWEPLPYA